MAAGSDVSQIVLQMSNAAAQLVVDPLIRRGILFFKGGVRGDVLGRFFSPMDLFRKQIKARENKKQIRRKLTLEWYASLVECCPP
jgi:hypothetical protein